MIYERYYIRHISAYDTEKKRIQFVHVYGSAHPVKSVQIIKYQKISLSKMLEKWANTPFSSDFECLGDFPDVSHKSAFIFSIINRKVLNPYACPRFVKFEKATNYFIGV